MSTLRIAADVLLAACLAAPVCAQEDKQETAKRPVGGPVALVMEGFKAPLRECVVSEDGSTAVLCTADDMVHFKNLADHLGKDKKQIGKSDNSFRYKITSVFLSPDGKRLFGVLNPSTMTAITKRPRILYNLRGMPGVILGALHPDGNSLIAGMTGGLLRDWDLNTGKPRGYHQFVGTKRPTWFGFHKDGNTLMLATNVLRYFAYPDRTKLREVEVPESITHIALSADGKTMVSHGGTKVQVWDVEKGEVQEEFDAKSKVRRTTISANGSTVAVAHEDGSAALHSVKTGKCSYAWPAHAGKEILCLQFIAGPKGRQLLVTAAKADDVVFWIVKKLKPADDGKKKSKKKRRRR